MSDKENFGFGKFVPGFDFLQTLAKGATSLPQMPSLSNWVAPTLNVEELEKRIGELKAVNFWLDQNSKALGATIQALEVQKMTLATLRGMNLNMTEMANALKLKPVDLTAGDAAGAAAETAAPTGPVPHEASKPRAKANGARAPKAAAPGNKVVDPLQWWGALTQQFQQIAAGALKDAAANPAMDAARKMTTGAATDALKAATGAAGAKRAPATRARKAAPAKTAARKAKPRG